ncbi:deaminase [Methylobacterium soli]|uniref:deaminase n=1 Tax=Methylobacterium soli TaxID=553447 RepID=UPI0017852135|nr:deaminase [Methylobacterium soli]
MGAAIFSEEGEVISLGTNEVPKAGDGTYWTNDVHDDRDYKRGKDSNDKRKKKILYELMRAFDENVKIEELLNITRIKKSQFMDALEYGRIIHAEMSAICDGARTGRLLKNSILYCTTFPCHMCAKHIVAAGVSEVIFLEPYPKSLASELHGDAIEIEGQPRGIYSSYPKTLFRHFYGVSPKRYRDLFEKHKRKDENGQFLLWGEGSKAPIIDIRVHPQHFHFEPIVVKETLEVQLDKFSIPIEIVKIDQLDLR